MILIYISGFGKIFIYFKEIYILKVFYLGGHFYRCVLPIPTGLKQQVLFSPSFHYFENIVFLIKIMWNKTKHSVGLWIL